MKSNEIWEEKLQKKSLCDWRLEWEGRRTIGRSVVHISNGIAWNEDNRIYSACYGIFHLTLIQLWSQTLISYHYVFSLCVLHSFFVFFYFIFIFSFFKASMNYEQDSKLDSCSIQFAMKKNWIIVFWVCVCVSVSEALWNIFRNKGIERENSEWSAQTLENPIHSNKSSVPNNVHPPIWSFFPFVNEKQKQGMRERESTTTLITTTTLKTHR